MNGLMRAIWRVRTDAGASSVEYVGITVVVIAVIGALTVSTTGIGQAIGQGAERAVCAALDTCAAPPLDSPALPAARQVDGPPPQIVPTQRTATNVADAPNVDPFGDPVVVLPDGTVMPISGGVPINPATGQPLEVTTDPVTGERVVVLPDGSTQPLPPDGEDALSPSLPGVGDGPDAGAEPDGTDPRAGDAPDTGDPGTGGSSTGEGPVAGEPGTGGAPSAGDVPGGADPGSGRTAGGGQGPTAGDVSSLTGDASTVAGRGGPEPGAASGPATPGGTNPDDPGANDAVAGDPVNTRTGAFVTQGVDLVLPGPGQPLALTRSYSSTDTRSGPLGRGWTLSYDVGIEREAAGRILVRTASGYRVPFDVDPETAEITAPPGIHSTLARAGDGYLLTRRDGDTITFDGQGRALRMAGADGLTTELDYDDSGRLVTVTDAVGRSLELTWDGDRVIRAELPDGRTVAYGYAEGLLVEIVDAQGASERYAYDEQGRVSSVTDNEGDLVVDNVYDDAGRVVEQTDVLGHTYRFQYLTQGPYAVTIHTAPTADRTAYVYSGERLVRTRDPLGSTHTMRYDDDLNLVEIVDAKGVSYRASFDDRGQILAWQAPEGRELSFRWGPHNTLTQVVDATGAVTRMTYDDAGRLLSVVAPDGGETTYHYDGDIAGLVTSVTNAEGNTVTVEHDDLGRTTSMTGPTGSRVELRYDEAGNVVGFVDAAGFVDGADPDEHTWTFSYDAMNRMVQAVDPLDGTIEVTYDAMSRVTSVVDPDEERTVYEYDDRGRLASVVAPDQTETRYGYDALDRIIRRTTPLGEVTQYGYDPAGRLVATVSPAGQRWTYAYDANDNLVEMVTPEGLATENPARGRVRWQYDDLNRPVAVMPSDAPQVDVQWGPDNRPRSVSDATGSAAFGYDEAGRLATVDRDDEDLSYAYDLLGNLVERVVGDRVTAYDYDDAGRLVTVDGEDVSASYTYDPAGRMVEAALGNGARTEAAWDPLGRIAKITHTDGDGELVSTASYTYAPDGMPRTVRGLDEVASFRYDDLDRLVQATVTARASGTERGQWTYQYDDAGRRIAQRTPEGVSELTWEAADQLVAVTGPDGSTTEMGYDANGRRTRVGDDTFRFNVFEQLVEQQVDGTTTEFTHDAAGRRVAETVDGEPARRYTWDPNAVNAQLAGLEDPDGEQQAFALLPGAGTLGSSADDDVTYLHADGLGSVTGTTTESGDVGWRYGYTAFGEARGSAQVADGAPGSVLRFAGELLDPSSQDYHLRARQMDPSTGTFTSIDPAPDLLREPYAPVYAYVDNKPTVYTDPSGEFFNVVAGAVGAAVGAAGGAVVSVVVQAASGEDVNWSEVGAAAAGGAVAGFVTGATGGLALLAGGGMAGTLSTVGIGAVAGVAGDSTTQSLNLAAGNQSGWNWGSTGTAFALGGVTNLAGSSVARAVARGPDNPHGLGLAGEAILGGYFGLKIELPSQLIIQELRPTSAAVS